MVQSIYLHVSHFQQSCKGVSTHVEDWITRTGVESPRRTEKSSGKYSGTSYSASVPRHPFPCLNLSACWQCFRKFVRFVGHDKSF